MAQNDDGTFDLAAELAAGNIELVQPGTPDALAFDDEMVADTPDYDERLLAAEGADALTSDRHLRQVALVAERDPDYLAYAFGAWCRSRGWERSDLASYLGVTVNQLAAMAITRRANPGYLLDAGVPQVDLAERFGADAKRLAEVLAF